MVGTQRAQLLVDRLDLGLEVVHQQQAGVDGRSPGLRNVEALQQLTAGDAEQVSHRAWVTKRIDKDVRQEYWSAVRGAPERAHEGVIHA